MSSRRDDLKAGLSKSNEIRITVIGRKSGKAISNPVWFVLEGEKLWLLPVQGSDTQWYKNVLEKPQLRVETRGKEAELRPRAVTDANTVKTVVEKFRKKYGAGDVKKYYTKLDVAVEADIAA